VTDPKQGPRVKDRDALTRARHAGDECVACGRPPSNVHHFVPKAAPWLGDDVDANLVLLCGTGTVGCHGALHGSPYTDHAGQRWTMAETAAAVGRHVAAHRPDTVEYTLTHLGWSAGREFLRRHYSLVLPDDYAAA